MQRELSSSAISAEDGNFSDHHSTQTPSVRRFGMESMSGSFRILVDSSGAPYYSIRTEKFDNPLNLSNIRLEEGNVAGFLDPIFRVDTRKTGPFTRDYTRRDDVLLAFLTLFLLLVIDAIVATILLRTKHGYISNFGFSVKVVLEYFREFKPIRAFKPRYREQKVDHFPRKINARLLVIAVSLLILTVGLEVGVLFSTDPLFKRVANDTVTFRIKQPILPYWDDVRFHMRASFNRPCTAMGLRGVEQGSTRINGCVSTNLSTSAFDFFQEADNAVDFQILSRLHRFGADHQISVDGLSATYTARAYFSLYDGKTRLMMQAQKERQESLHTKAMHQQYFAYLFSAYNRTAKESGEFFLDRLNELEFSTDERREESETILEIEDKGITSAVTEYTTRVKGVFPRGLPALRLGEHFFKGTTAMVVALPNQTDLFLETGMDSAHAVVWEEASRPINLLSLSIMLIAALLLLAALRVGLKPVAIAEIAGMWVKKSVGTDVKASAAVLDGSEDEYFALMRREEYALEDTSAKRRPD